MCGIAGLIFPPNRSCPEPPEGLMAKMLESLSHRGPDGDGIWISGDRSVIIGHRRLSIIDRSENGRQPMIGRRGAVLTYNGELYNFRELRRDFPADSFASKSDSEVLLRCYEENGANFLKGLNGMFAFGIWDPGTHTMLLARDRVGIKNLYFTTLGGVFAFASEIKALLRLPWVHAELDDEALYHFLGHNHVKPPFTMFKGISKMHPGHQMVVKDAVIKDYRPFWTPCWEAPSTGTEQELLSQLHDELESSVSRQLVSDVKVGVFLSGGVDSSGIVALANKHSSSPLNTYSVGFKDAPGYTEVDFAAKIARKFKTNHVERFVSKEDISESLPKLIEAYDEPLADATSIPIHFISELARSDGSHVVLTGDGADELFFGYRRWGKYAKMAPWYRAYRKLPQFVRRGSLEFYSRFDSTSARHELLRQAACGYQHYRGYGGLRPNARDNVITAEYCDRMAGSDLDRIGRASYTDAFPNKSMRGDISRMCYAGFSDAVPNFYCYRADRMGMANSIELRVPFLDNRIVDLAFSLPQHLKLKNGIPKYLLKAALESELPREVLYRKKMGFCVPMREWVDDSCSNYIEKHITAFCRDTGLFDEAGIRNQLSQIKGRRSNNSFGIWNLYFLIAWFRKWML